MGQVMKERLSCYLVLLSFDSKTSWQDKSHLHAYKLYILCNFLLGVDDMCMRCHLQTSAGFFNSLSVSDIYMYVSLIWAIDGSDNGSSGDWHQAVIWSNSGILLTGPLGTNINEFCTQLPQFSNKKNKLNMPCAKWLPICLGLSVLMRVISWITTEVSTGLKIHLCSWQQEGLVDFF